MPLQGGGVSVRNILAARQVSMETRDQIRASWTLEDAMNFTGMFFRFQILDIELVYSIWQYNGSIYGPYAADDVCKFFIEEKLQFPTRIHITELRKRGEPYLDWFGTIRDLQDMFGPQDFFPKRLSQFRGKWPLPEIHPNVGLLEANTSFLSFNLATFMSNLTTSPYCPFITGVDEEVPEEHLLPLSSAIDLARRLLMEYSNLELEERQHLHILLTEVFSPRICDVCQKVMEDQHTYMIHALSIIHLENAILRGKKHFTIEFDYLKLRKLLDEVKKHTFDRKLCRILTKVVHTPRVPVVQQIQIQLPVYQPTPQPQIWPPTWIGNDFPRNQPLPL